MRLAFHFVMHTMNARVRTQSLVTIVDDEPSIRKSLGRFLRSVGYQTAAFSSAEDFLARGCENDAACVILDIRLPGMDGLELLRYLADQRPGRSIVIVSGKVTENERIQAMMTGATAFLIKPFSDELLLKAVHVAIARRDFASA